MKNILILALFATPAFGFSQVQFSDERPDAPTIVKKLQPKVDTVFVLTAAGIEKGVRVTPVYEILYDRDRSQEEERFYGNSDFFVKDKDGRWNKPVKPMAYRFMINFSNITFGPTLNQIDIFPNYNLGQ